MSVMYGHFDVENLATQLITDAAAVGMQQQTKPVSEDYHQSQKASQGAGPSGLSARQIAEETFSKLGFDTLNKYIEKNGLKTRQSEMVEHGGQTYE